MFRSDSSSLPLVDVDALRVGMFIHVDLSWIEHPFPLSRFCISSVDQIETLRGLGLKQVRWNPQQSVTSPPADGTSGAADVSAAPGAVVASDSTEAGRDVQQEPGPDSEPDAVAAARRPPIDDGVAARRAQLQAQRVAIATCERQFQEAARVCHDCFKAADRDSAAAGEQARALARALADKLLGEGDLCVRVLSSHGGERMSAHAVNVGVLAMLMGRALMWDESDLMDLGLGALTHDIGKLDIPDRVRWRRDDFSGPEMRLYQEHVARGVNRGRHMGLPPAALAVIAEHHEAADKSGFPRGIGADRMSAAARIVSLVDRYDHLCNPVQSAFALTPHEAMSQIFSQGRNKYDLTILAAFIKLMGVYPAGSLVQLSDDRLAIVMAVRSSLHSPRPRKAIVMAYDPRLPRDEALLIDLETRSDLAISRSVRAQSLPPEVRGYLQPPQRMNYGFEKVAPGD